MYVAPYIFVDSLSLRLTGFVGVSFEFNLTLHYCGWKTTILKFDVYIKTA